MTPVILWFRRNLRITDNNALIAAVETGCPIIPVYIADEQDKGGASRWWLHNSLKRLDQSLSDIGGELVLRQGEPVTVLSEIVSTTGASGVYFANRYEPESCRQQEALLAALGDDVDVIAFDDSLLTRPDRVLTKSGTPYKVFTPYWRAASALGDPSLPQPVPDPVIFARHSLESDPLDALGLLPVPDWAQGLRDKWTPGEEGAAARIDALSVTAQGYSMHRDRPDLDATTRLSPHLHFGEVSVRQVWHAVRDLESQLRATAGPEALLRQLYWRDFSSYLLYHYPSLPDTPLRPEFESFPWDDNEALLSAWQRGQTGFPIVDAGMRQLWHTGWMHNRVRMIVASFLVKDLLISWQHGAEWFSDTLVDADPGNNSAGWQWVAGCGTDSAPYFRIFNPVLQGKKFDPDGVYVRKWVPEIAALPNAVVQEPWMAPMDQQRKLGVLIGKDYPAPIVDRSNSRQRALDAYASIRGDDMLVTA